MARGIIDDAEAHFEHADDADQAGRGRGDDEPMNETTRNAFCIGCGEADEDETGLAEAQVGEQAAWFFLRKSTKASDERRGERDEAKDIERVLGGQRECRCLGSGDEKGSEVAVEEQRGGQQRAVFKGVNHPTMEGENSFA